MTMPDPNQPPFDGMAFAKTLPSTPGVYRYYDAAGRLLYVGKARDLKRRVSSYFQRTPDDARVASMVSKIRRATFTVVPTEVDALILENRLINEEKPRYNIQMRDGRGYPYLHLSTDKKVPQLRVHYGVRGHTGRYFGPFPSRQAIHESHELLQKHFGLRTCSDVFFAGRSRPCLENQIGRCTAPCVGIISPEGYAERVAELVLFLDGKSGGVIQSLTTRMEEAANSLDYESASLWRDRIVSLRHVQSKISVEAGAGSFDAIAVASDNGTTCVSVVVVRQGQVVGVRAVQFVPPWDTPEDVLAAQFIAQHYLAGEAPIPEEILVATPIPDQERALLASALSTRRPVAITCMVRGDRKRQLDLAQANASASLASYLREEKAWDARWSDLTQVLGLPSPPERTECFDISHTQGEATVASCVVFGPKGALKSSYRRFNIVDVPAGDDYAALAQAVGRRFKGTTPHPDLLLIDGGLGQLHATIPVARAQGYQGPIIGVSKGPARKPGDEVLVFEDGRTIAPGAHALALQVIQMVRDEAHRFAITGHRAKRDKRRVTSVLENIPNVGPNRRQALLTAFGGIQGLKAASVEQIAQVPGVGEGLAAQIHKALNA